MAKVKIGKKEYELESISTLDIKKLDKIKKEDKLSNYDYAFAMVLYTIKKFNKNIELTLDQFMDEIPIKDVDKKFEEIGEIIGLDFKIGIGKLEVGKKQ